MPGAHLIHGSSATAWMAVPVAQAWLIRRGKVKLHRTLGRFSLLLAPVVVLGGLRVVQIMALKMCLPNRGKIPARVMRARRGSVLDVRRTNVNE